MDIDAVIKAGEEYWDYTCERKLVQVQRDVHGMFRLSGETELVCCSAGFLTDLRAAQHVRNILHLSNKYGVPYWLLYDSLNSIGAGNGVPPEAIARYAAYRLRGGRFPPELGSITDSNGNRFEGNRFAVVDPQESTQHEA